LIHLQKNISFKNFSQCRNWKNKYSFWSVMLVVFIIDAKLLNILGQWVIAYFPSRSNFFQEFVRQYCVWINYIFPATFVHNQRCKEIGNQLNKCSEESYSTSLECGRCTTQHTCTWHKKIINLSSDWCASSKYYFLRNFIINILKKSLVFFISDSRLFLGHWLYHLSSRIH
jgi:hypothetical protein